MKELVSNERRKHNRILKPIDGRWRGGAAGGQCRIGDLSLGGCFVHALSGPALGETTSVSFQTEGGLQLSFEGVVVHIEPRIGFSVEFREIPADDAQQLVAYLEHLRNA